MGAIRLPSDAFKREGTAVVTDIVFLAQARAGRSRPAMPIRDWLGIAPLAIEGAEVPINRYFLNHPEMVLGDWTRKDTLYGGEGYSVTGNGDLAGQLQARHQPPARVRAARRRRRVQERTCTGFRPAAAASATSAKAASSSATTGSSTRSKAARECRSSMAARR